MEIKREELEKMKQASACARQGAIAALQGKYTEAERLVLLQAEIIMALTSNLTRLVDHVQTTEKLPEDFDVDQIIKESSP